MVRPARPVAHSLSPRENCAGSPDSGSPSPRRSPPTARGRPLGERVPACLPAHGGSAAPHLGGDRSPRRHALLGGASIGTRFLEPFRRRSVPEYPTSCRFGSGAPSL